MNNLLTTSILNEKDVENLYRQYLTKKFGDIIFNSPFGCDGYGESKKHKIRLLCEFKDDLDLTFKVNQVKVLSQALYYIKKFEISFISSKLNIILISFIYLYIEQLMLIIFC